jgi:hypothetical protein
MGYSLILVLSLYILVAAFGWALTWMNLAYLKATGAEVPPGFEGCLDAPVLERMRNYTVEEARLGVFESACGAALVVFFVVFVLGPYDEWIASLGLPFVAHGVLFFMLLICGEAILSIPFSLTGFSALKKDTVFPI